MTKNNVFEEIKKLIQQIKNEYREGVDYEFVTGNEAHKRGAMWVDILSSRLKKYLREKFNFPLSFNDYLDYQKEDEGGNWFTYRTIKDTTKYSGWDSIFFSEGEGKDTGQEAKPKNCVVCSKLAFEENGRMRLWDGEKVTNGPRPNIIGYFHPECAKKHFADKVQPNQNETSRLKEKILRNLDKICLDPMGNLSNAEMLANEEVERNYHHSVVNEKFIKKAWRVEIEGEEIDLEKQVYCGSDDYFEIKAALINEIKQNPSEWKIIKGGEEIMGKNNWIVKHQSGRRHWKFGICHLRGENIGKEKGIGERGWAEIEALINGSPLPVNNQKSTNSELENLKTIFRQHNIRKITFKNGKLVIEYNKKINSLKKVVNNQEFQQLSNYCQTHNEQEITWERLNNISNNNSTNNKVSQFENKYLWLAGGITLGIIISSILVYFLRKKKNKN